MVPKGRPWGLPLEVRALLVAAYWRTNLTMRQLAPLFGVSKSAADRINDHLEPKLALQPRQRFAKDTDLEAVMRGTGPHDCQHDERRGVAEAGVLPVFVSAGPLPTRPSRPPALLLTWPGRWRVRDRHHQA